MVHIVYMRGNQHDDHTITTYSHHDTLENALGSKEAALDSMVYSYKHGFSGFAAKLTVAEAQKMAGLSGVERVVPNRLYKIDTTRSWDHLGLSSSPSPNNLLHESNMGDDVIIGVLDTEIWPESESFSDEGLGPIPSRWKGTCETGDQFNSTYCNKKIIGARWFIKGFLADFQESFNASFNATRSFDFLSPRDADGHGTHTSSTAAGSLVANASYKGLGLGTIRGGAPKARLAMYKVCWNGGECALADILKAFDEAINDGVDVISVSLGFGIPSQPDVEDALAVGSFNAVAKGITVVCSGGNSGPVGQTVGNTSPWILTVAASPRLTDPSPHQLLLEMAKL